MIDIYPSIFLRQKRLKILYGCYHPVNYQELMLVTGLPIESIRPIIKTCINVGLVKKDVNPSRKRSNKLYVIATHRGRKVIEYSYKMLENEKKAKQNL